MGFSLPQKGKYLLSPPMPFTAGQQLAGTPSAPGCSLLSGGIRFFFSIYKKRNHHLTMFCSRKLSAVKSALSLFRGAALGTIREKPKAFSFLEIVRKYSQAFCL